MDYPELELQDGPGRQPGQRRPQDAARRRSSRSSPPTSAAATSTWSAAAPPRRRGSCSATRSPARWSRRARTSSSSRSATSCSVPFNIACGRCRNCKEGKTGICLNVNPDRPGSAYGYVDMGGWVGGQAEYVMVPVRRLEPAAVPRPGPGDGEDPRPDHAVATSSRPATTAASAPASTTGSTVYIAGAGPVGLAAATSALLLGAAVVIVGDLNEERLAQARSFGCETVDVLRGRPRQASRSTQILGDAARSTAAVDAVGFEARGHGADAGTETPATVLNSLMDDHPGRRRARHPRPVRHRRPGRRRRGGQGRARCRSGSAWAGRSRTAFTTGQCPVMKYNRQLMMAILHDRVQIAKDVNATVIPLDEAPQRLRRTSTRARPASTSSTPHGMVGAA